jgi:hypothetical protein
MMQGCGRVRWLARPSRHRGTTVREFMDRYTLEDGSRLYVLTEEQVKYLASWEMGT